MIEIKERLIKQEHWPRKCPILITPRYITIHEMNTWQDAEDCAKYASRSLDPSAAHIYVDERQAIQIIPLDRCAQACGDRDGPGNRESISVEICRSEAPGTLYYQAMANTILIVRQLMDQLQIIPDHVVMHYDWTGTNCPKRMLKEGLWSVFLRSLFDNEKGGNV